MIRVGYPPHIRDTIRERERFAAELSRLKRPARGRYAPAYVFAELTADFASVSAAACSGAS